MRLTAKQREQDEAILNTIVSAAAAIKREVRPHYPVTKADYCDDIALGSNTVPGSGNAYGLKSKSMKVNTRGACCAIGAGIVYAGLDYKPYLERGHLNPALTAFANTYDVSERYAAGVSEAFESDTHETDGKINDDPEYARGYAVGRAIFAALYDVEDAS